MKIKTIWRKTIKHFDDEVNEAVAEGWRLVKRELVVDTRNLDDSVFYAELVQLDPEPVPEARPLDHFEALRAIKAACLNVPQSECDAGRCPLYSWCVSVAESHDPTDWDIPEKEAPEA